MAEQKGADLARTFTIPSTSKAPWLTIRGEHKTLSLREEFSWRVGEIAAPKGALACDGGSEAQSRAGLGPP